MSCGKPHATDCSDVIERVYLYLDGEADDFDCSRIREHLDECSPCLAQYGLEQEVKTLVPAPAEATMCLRIYVSESWLA